jgi:hypothetical protein
MQEKEQLDSVDHEIAQCESFPNNASFGKTFPYVKGKGHVSIG